MQWCIDYPNAGNIIADYERYKQPVPEKLIPPELHDVEWDYWNAFWELSSSRNNGDKINPIPWVIIDKYANEHTQYCKRDFMKIMRSIDNVYLSIQGAKQR